MQILKQAVSLAPMGLQQELRRMKCFVDIKLGLHRSSEPEFDHLANYVTAGDWVIDVGANVGTYTLHLAQLVGPTGRVISFEPITETAEVLAAAVRWAGLKNVTIMNAAASSGSTEVGLSITNAATGLPDYFTATINANGDKKVLAVAIDSLQLDHPITLVKIDAEGHERDVLQGMTRTLARDKPTLIVEDGAHLIPWLTELGYRVDPYIPGSANYVFHAR
ncbi:MAG: FkbM family methyltransferase [Polyangia bacterium]